MLNTNAIDKIIGEMSMQCYKSAQKKSKKRIKSYSLSEECLEAIQKHCRLLLTAFDKLDVALV